VRREEGGKARGQMTENRRQKGENNRRGKAGKQRSEVRASEVGKMDGTGKEKDYHGNAQN
jgi:hypothetical protein